jgi:hypothetical protein
MRFWDVSPETLKESQQMGSSALVPPDDAKPDTRDPEALRWTEVVQVETLRVEEHQWEGDPDHWQRFGAQLRIQPEMPGTKNAGRVLFADHMVSEEHFFKAQHKDTKPYKQSKFSINLISQLLRACGYEWDQSLGIPKEVFSEAFGDESPLIGQKLYVEVKQSPRRVRDAEQQLVVDPEGRKRDEPMRYVSYDG